MIALPEMFFELASARLAEYPHLSHEWLRPDRNEKRILRIPRTEPDGFDVEIECET